MEVLQSSPAVGLQQLDQSRIGMSLCNQINRSCHIAWWLTVCLDVLS